MTIACMVREKLIARRVGYLFLHTEIDLDSKKEFARICDNIPEAHVSRTGSVQYVRQPGATDEEVYWVKKIYDNVRYL